MRACEALGGLARCGRRCGPHCRAIQPATPTTRQFLVNGRINDRRHPNASAKRPSAITVALLRSWLMAKQYGSMKHLRLRIAVPLVALALLAAACSGTETAAPDVAASDNGASDTDAGDTTADNADADADDGTTTTDTAAETAVADNENLDAYEGLNEGEIESAKREEEVRRVIARAEAADAEAAEAETADAVETQPSETRETDTQSTDTQPEETQPSVPRFDADGTERLGDRVAGYDPKVFRDTRNRAITDRTTVHTDVVGGGGKYFVAEIHNADTGAREAGNRWVYVDARGPQEGETISRTYDFEAYTTIDGKKRMHLNKYWNEPVPIRENLDIRLRINESGVMLHLRLSGWKKVGHLTQHGSTHRFQYDNKDSDKIYEPFPIRLPEGRERWDAQEWYVYECRYAIDGEEFPVGEGSLRLFRVFEIGTELPLPGLNDGVAWMKSGVTGTGVPAGSC